MSDATPPIESPDFDAMTRDIADVPAVEVIMTVAVHLMSAAAVKLGLTEDGDKYKDLDEARKLITPWPAWSPRAHGSAPSTRRRCATA